MKITFSITKREDGTPTYVDLSEYHYPKQLNSGGWWGIFRENVDYYWIDLNIYEGGHTRINNALDFFNINFRK